MDISELGITWTQLGLVVIATIGIYLVVVTYTRVLGQRTLSSFSSFDFAVSVALGAIVGRVVLVRTSLMGGIVGLAVLFGLQLGVSVLRRRPGLRRLVDHPPVLLARDGRLIEEGLRRTHLRPVDIYERVRAEGLGDLARAQAVILERNGSVSIIQSGEPVEDYVFGDIPGFLTPRSTD